jgi:hypothetical protein
MRASPRRWLAIVCILLGPLLLSPIAASARWHRALTPEDAAALRPGQYLWQADPDSLAPVGVLVDLARQRAFVYLGARLVGISTVSTGRRHYETPAGTFPILEKAVWHRSTLYSDAPMPYMQRLTWGGVALHAGGVPGYRQSHGCIHLPRAFAMKLYRATRIGSVVRVVRRLPGGRLSAPAPIRFVALYEDMPTTPEAVAQMTAL